MVVSEATRARTRRDKAFVMEATIPLEATNVSGSSQADPRPVDQNPPKQEAYVMVHALKNFMSTMADAIIQQVSK